MPSLNRRHKIPLDARSPVHTAAMAVLLKEPGNGYDVTRRINRLMGPSWNLEAKQIYTVLNRLVRHGLVHRDAQKIYYPTEKGRLAYLEWLKTSSELTLVRGDIQVRLAFSKEEDVPELFALLEDYRTELLQVREDNAVGHGEVETWDGLTLRLTRTGIEERLKAELMWVEKVCEELERRSR